MKITPFSARPLALAVVTALALSSPVVGKSIDKLSDSPAAASGLFTGTVLFGGASSSEAGASSVSGLPVIGPADAENLAPGAVRHVLVVVRASSLPLGEEDAATLARLFQQGAPEEPLDGPAPEIVGTGPALGGGHHLGGHLRRDAQDPRRRAVEKNGFVVWIVHGVCVRGGRLRRDCLSR